MSFSNEVKNELARLPITVGLEAKAELLGLLRGGGSLPGQELAAAYVTENAASARRVWQLFRAHYRLPAKVVITRNRRLKKNNRYQVLVQPSQATAQALAELGLQLADSANPLLASALGRRCYLRGLFLGGGSISKPSGDYHLEIALNNQEVARSLCKLMGRFSLKAKLTERKRDYVVYLKDGEGIARFLNLSGAHASLLTFESARVLKELRNKVNRAVNCETANLNKVVRSSMRQVACINFLQERLGLEELPEPLLFVARLRLAHPDLSLAELVEYSQGLGKSGINHRLKKLEALAVSLGLEGEADCVEKGA